MANHMSYFVECPSFSRFLPRAGAGSVCLWHSSLYYMCACLATYSLWLSLYPLGTCWCVCKGTHTYTYSDVSVFHYDLVFGDHSLTKHGVHWFSKNSWSVGPGDSLVCLCLQSARILSKGTMPDLYMGAGVLTQVRHHKHLANSSVYEALNY